MEPDTYPPGTVRALLATNSVTPATRAALGPRLERSTAAAPQFLDAPALSVLRAVCARLIPQSADAGPPLDIAGNIDARLAEGKGNGWRYDVLPPDGEAYRRGLQGLDESARLIHNVEFPLLTDSQKDEIISAVQRGEAPGDIWRTLSGARFLEELRVEAAECYYSDPVAQEEIGYVGMADAHGWSRIGLNEREAWEPTPQSRPMDVGAGFVRPLSNPAPTPPAVSQSASFATHDLVDAVVIGTGAGGAPLLARLAQAGLKVVALEAGKHWDPAQDFATDERAQSKLFWNDERLSAGSDPTPFGDNNSGIGVGGSTLHYTAYTPRVQPNDLRLHTHFGVGCDWPLAFEDLEPYYDELEAFLGVSGPSSYPWGPPRRAGYPLPPLPLNGAAQLMQRACAKMGIRTSPAANAALSSPYFRPGVGWRQACTNRGFCQAGCSTGAKASMDVTFIPLALSHGAEVRAECFVTGIELDKQGRISGIVYTQQGREERQRCRSLFLCAGAVETPRLLLRNNLGNGSGQVGRNFMAHTGVQVWGQFAEDVRPYKGIPGALISEDTHRPQQQNAAWGAADFAGGYLLQSIGVMPVTYASQAARGHGLWGEALKDHMRGYNHFAGINILGDCLPSERNFLELSEENDARGLPKPRIHFTAGENEKKMTAHAETLMRAIWAAAGGEGLWAFPRYAHTVGTCRMGRDESSAVVDSDGRSFDVPNLFISDNSTFPSALSVNPALTIMALSLRTADRFLEHGRRGDN